MDSSQQALTLLSHEFFDAVVTDLRMPDLDGVSLITQSRRQAPGLPILVMTAYGAIDSAIESIRQGAYHYLTKPFKLDELVLFLRRAIEESRMRREATALRTILQQRSGRKTLSRRLRVGLCSSMKSETYRWLSRGSCCMCWNKGRFDRSGPIEPAGSMSAS